MHSWATTPSTVARVTTRCTAITATTRSMAAPGKTRSSAVGATMLVSLAAWWLSQFEFLPIVGEWARQIADQIAQPR